MTLAMSNGYSKKEEFYNSIEEQKELDNMQGDE